MSLQARRCRAPGKTGAPRREGAHEHCSGTVEVALTGVGGGETVDQTPFLPGERRVMNGDACHLPRAIFNQVSQDFGLLATAAVTTLLNQRG